MNEESSTAVANTLKTAVESLFQGGGLAAGDPDELLVDLAQKADVAATALRNTLAEILTTRLNAIVPRATQATFLQKQKVAFAVNEICRAFDVGVTDPKTGIPGLLKAHYKQNPKEERGYFMVEFRERAGAYSKVRHRTLDSPLKLTLAAKPTEREAQGQMDRHAESQQGGGGIGRT